MRRLHRGAAFWLAVLGAVPVAAQQQAAAPIPQPKLHSVQPAGAKAGGAAEVRILGVDLDKADRLIFSHPGLSAEPLVSPADRFYPQPRTVENAFRVAVKADVPPGIYEVRAAGFFGLSNARRFVVGDREETTEKEPNNDAANLLETPVDTVVNGACDAQGLDHIAFPGKKGQRFVVDAMALRIDSRALLVVTLLDAAGRELRRAAATRYGDPLIDYTPAEDGPLTLRIHDQTYRGGDDFPYRLAVTTAPWIDFADPPMLRPGVENEVTLFGRNLPGGGPAGIALDGVPLEKLAVRIAGPADPAASHPPGDAFLRPVDAAGDFVTWRLGRSNPVRFLVSDEPVVREAEPNDDAEKAIEVALPVQVAGRFQSRGDRDWVAFSAKKGEKLWIEVFSQRLGLPTDPTILVQQGTTNDKGETTWKDLQEADDQPTPLPAMQGNAERRYRLGPEDPALLVTAPQDGRYRVLVRDLFSSAQGDPRLAYRLVIRAARPDFRLVALPVENFAGDNRIDIVSCVLRRGGAERLRVLALRREGFDGSIRVEAEGLPPGVTARPAVIGPGRGSADLVLVAAADAAAFAGAIRLVGRGESEGRALLRPARAAEVIWGAATQTEGLSLRVTDRVTLGVDAATPAPLGLSIGGEPAVRAPRGGKLRIPIKLVKNADAKDLDKAQVKLGGVGLPAGPNNQKPVALKDVTLTLAKAEGELEIDFTDAAPLGPFTFYVTGEVTFPLARPAARRLDEDKKRIDEVAKQVAAEAKQAEQAREKRDREAQESAKALEEAKARLASVTGNEREKAEEALKEAEAKARAAEEARAKAVEAEAKAKELARAADAHVKSLTEESKKAADNAKEKRVRAWIASLPVSVEVVQHPVSLQLDSLTVYLAPGGRADVEVAVTREASTEEVRLELVAPKDAPLLKPAAAVEVPAGRTQASMSFYADPSVKPGQYTATLRAAVKFNGKSVTIDQPVKVQVDAPAKP